MDHSPQSGWEPRWILDFPQPSSPPCPANGSCTYKCLLTAEVTLSPPPTQNISPCQRLGPAQPSNINQGAVRHNAATLAFKQTVLLRKGKSSSDICKSSYPCQDLENNGSRWHCQNPDAMGLAAGVRSKALGQPEAMHRRGTC
jgi:hypothetical protein